MATERDPAQSARPPAAPQLATPAAGSGEKLFACNLCESLCGLRLEVEGAKVVGLRGDPDDPFSRDHICPKAIGLRELLDDPDRLRAPLLRDGNGILKPASWDQALESVSSRLRDIRRRYGPDSIALYVGNPVVHSHRSSLGAQLLTTALATHNRFDPNSQDSNPRLFACMQMYGDALALPVPDIDRTDYLLLLGANPAVSNGSMWALGDPRGRFKALVARGGRVVLIDPRRTESAAWSTSHHPIRPGGDAALCLAMLHVFFKENLVDLDKLRGSGSGVDDLIKLVSPFPPERVAPAIGMDSNTITTLARDFASSKAACAYARVGVCQGRFGPLASWLVELLNVVTGNFDRPGGAMFPTPAADIAPLGRLLIGNHWARFRSRVRGLPEFLGAIPSAAMLEEMETKGKGQVRALVCFAGNPVLSTPGGARLSAALEKLELVVSVDYYLNETSRHAHAVLPPRHVFETGNFDLLLQRFTVENGARYCPPILKTDDDTRDDWEIACELAIRTRLPKFEPLRKLLRALARNLPERALDLLLRLGPRKLTLKKLAEAPRGMHYGALVPRRAECVRTNDGRVQLVPEIFAADLPRLAQWLDEASSGALVLIGRRNLRSNNSWMHNLPALAKGPDRARLLMNPQDAARLSLLAGARVRVRSAAGAVETLLSLSDEVMPGVVSLPHGFGHQEAAATLRVAGALAGPNVNALTSQEEIEPILGTSILNGLHVVVEAAP